MGLILDEKYGIQVELRRESCHINETASETGEPHVFAYPHTDGTVALEMSYDFIKRLLRFIDGNKDLQERLLKAERKRIDGDSG